MTVAGSVSTSWRASPTFTASATRCCCAPSCRLRSMRRRDSSAAVDDAAPGGLQLLVALPQRLEAGLQGRVELHVVERQADLAGELGEHALVLVGEGVRVRRALDHDEPEQLAGVGDRRDPDDALAPVRRAARAATPAATRGRRRGPGTDGQLLGRQDEPARAALGNRDDPLEDPSCRSTPRPPPAAGSASATRPAGAAARRCGMARDIRVPNVCIASSGACRSP